MQPSQGRYLDRTWRIEEDHLIWWDDKPYIGYGFTGNGDTDRLIKLGFDQFNVGPCEQVEGHQDDTGSPPGIIGGAQHGDQAYTGVGADESAHVA